MPHLRDCSFGETLHQGMDTLVRRAKHVPDGAAWVVKMSLPGAAYQRSAGRIVHERRMLAKLEDVPGVVRAVGIEHDGNQAALFLEDQRLESLDRVLAERGRLSLHDVLAVGVETARVLENVHAAGVIHKDVKPQNMLWDEKNRRLTLLDFAIASELAEEAANPAIPEALEGTLAYMSPEQTGRLARGIDARTDLYSVGVVLFELICGHRPFVETDPLALVHAHLAKPVPDLHKLVHNVPPMVVKIVERCLEKHPDKRYQTAKGLGADLAHCLEELQNRESIDEFVLGSKDHSQVLRLPQALVSRNAEIKAIKEAFDRAAHGAVQVLLLSGSSGVGKTALVRSVYEEMAKAGRGLLLSGKHDQLGRSVPYAALAQAFGGLFRDVAASAKGVFDAWRRRLDNSLGPLSRIIADIVPELEWILGEIPPVPVVTPEMTYNRVKVSWIEFFRVVTETSPPLVLFLDDLQWVDPASLEILKTVLTDVAQKNIFVIAAYRDNEVDAAHPLNGLFEVLEKARANMSRLSVGPLDSKAVTEWLGVALSASEERVSGLALELHNKTHGNPFFLGQLLLELHRQKALRRDGDTGIWSWDQDAVRQAALTDNVVELMQRKVVELPAETQKLLGQAACAGHTFSLVELAVLSGHPVLTIARELHPAMLAGLVVPVDGHYREARALASSSSEVDAKYRFLHDRVQQAFYERIDHDERIQTHGLIGKRLRKVFDAEGGTNQKLLELVRHLNLGAGALKTDGERKDLARLDLRAAKAAKANGSYGLQAALVEQAQDLLGNRAWQDERDISLELALERIEADYMLRNFPEVHRRVDELLVLPLPKEARLSARSFQILCLQASAQFVEAERLGIEVLTELGGVFPENDDAAMVQCFMQLSVCQAWLDEHPEGFSLMPLETSTEHYLVDVIEASVATCVAFGSRPPLGGLITTRNVVRILERGTLTPASPYFISCNASLRAIILGKYREDIPWVQEGLAAAQRVASPYLAECLYLRAFYIPYEASVPKNREAFAAVTRTGLAAGSFQGTSWGLMGEVYCADLWPGGSLAYVSAQVNSRFESMTRYGDIMGLHGLALMKSIADFLRSPKNGDPRPDRPWLETPSSYFAAQHDNYMAELARVEEAHMYVAFGHYEKALASADDAEVHRGDAFAACPIPDIPLWRGLALAKLYAHAPTETRKQEILEGIEMALSRLQYFAHICPENFLHKLRILEAERARLSGENEVAARKYDEAIDAAKKEGFCQIEGLAAHFCAQFYRDLGRSRIAHLYLQESRDAYNRWDAQALVSHLELLYPELKSVEEIIIQSARPAIVATLASATETSSAMALDAHTVVRAAQALAGELDPDRVVGRLMELCLANAGAERGILVLLEKDALIVVARLSVRDMRIETGLSLPLAECEDVPPAVIHYVTRSRAPVVVNDVSTEKRFAEDSYFSRQSVRSLLAIPMTHGGRLGGVLYLEHRSIPSAFPESRVEMISVLVSQAAIAVENAKLVKNIEAQIRALEARNRDVQELNDELRRQIAQRSRRLMDSLMPPDESPATSGRLVPDGILGDCYRVLRSIGEGAMGMVYEVERTTDGKHLAAKVLNHNPDREDLGRFVREAQILASLSHPNLISIYDVDVTDAGILFIVMEFVAGTTLREISGRVGDVPWVLGVLRQIALALEALHASSVVHRDLKPENILVVTHDVDQVPEVKLADFGISIMNDNAPQLPMPTANAYDQTLVGGPTTKHGILERGPLLTQTGVLVGTPLYMGPELAYGSKNAHTSSDMFSFGVIAFELLKGERPYSFPPVLGGLIFDDVRERLRQCAGLSEAAARLIAQCLAVEPEKRPRAGEMVEGLGEV